MNHTIRTKEKGRGEKKSSAKSVYLFVHRLPFSLRFFPLHPRPKIYERMN